MHRGKKKREKAEENSTVCEGGVGEKEWECDERNAKLQKGGRDGGGVLSASDGNFTNEKAMTVLRFGLCVFWNRSKSC